MNATEYQPQPRAETRTNSQPTRAKTQGAEYKRSLLADRHVRRQAASQLMIRVEALRTLEAAPTAEEMAHNDLAELLAEVVAELRA